MRLLYLTALLVAPLLVAPLTIISILFGHRLYPCIFKNDCLGRRTRLGIQPFAFPKNPPPNSNVVITCNAHIGTEPISFVWFKDGQELQSATKLEAKIINETISILTVPKVSSEDVGNYTCKVTSLFGEALLHSAAFTHRSVLVIRAARSASNCKCIRVTAPEICGCCEDEDGGEVRTAK